jgi:dephospho-CoA kinase
MKIVGLAGESGTGKSTIAAHLMMRGGGHIDTDLVGHEILQHDESVRGQVRKRISADVFESDGRIDRRRLGAIVFNDGGLLETLGEIVHPAIRKVCGERVEEVKAAGVPFVTIDGALLLDSKMPFEWDLMIALSCDERELFDRLMAMGGRTVQEVRLRLRSQRGIRESFDRADVVVDTCRPKNEVLAEIDRLIDDLLDTE